jgi:hypothetical protein
VKQRRSSLVFVTPRGQPRQDQIEIDWANGFRLVSVAYSRTRRYLLNCMLCPG